MSEAPPPSGDEWADAARADLVKLAGYRMPFGRYKGRLLIDLPEPYVVWFRNQGFPPGELGRLLAITYEIKANGLEQLVRNVRRPTGDQPGGVTRPGSRPG